MQKIRCPIAESLWLFQQGEERQDSDLDLLVSFNHRISLLDLVALERELSECVGRNVDLVTEASLSPYLKDLILKEHQVVYGASCVLISEPSERSRSNSVG